MSEIRVRPALPSDLQALVELEARAMHFPKGHRVREWFRDDFPGDFRDRFAVAKHDGRLVSAAALLPLPIRYRGVPLEAATWDAVVTDEAYRQQGLCRRLFEALTPAEGPDALFVWGLTWLYRRFGYHPAMRNFGGLDSIKRSVRAASLAPSPLTVRDATPDDASFLRRLQDDAESRYVVAAPISEARWRYALRPDRTVAGPDETGLNRWRETRILQRDGVPVGFFTHDPWDLACLMEFEIVKGETIWREAGAAAIQATAAFARAENASLTLPGTHPIYAAYPHAFEPATRGYGGIAARIPDPVKFVRKIAPALERSLADSALAGWTGELTLSRIEDGLRLRLERGRLAEVAPWAGERPDEARARLMPGRFEALAFGYRSIAEILAEDPDCAVDEETEAVLTALFPPGDSFLGSV